MRLNEGTSNTVSTNSLSIYSNRAPDLRQTQHWGGAQLETEILKQKFLEREVRSLKTENDRLNSTLRAHDAMLFQRNAEWLQLCEENRALRTDLKSLESARELLLREVSVRLCIYRTLLLTAPSVRIRHSTFA